MPHSRRFAPLGASEVGTSRFRALW